MCKYGTCAECRRRVHREAMRDASIHAVSNEWVEVGTAGERRWVLRDNPSKILKVDDLALLNSLREMAAAGLLKNDEGE